MAHVALVTGASRGIGRAVAAQLAREGWAVCLHYHSQTAGAESLAAQLRAEGCTVAVRQADISDSGAVFSLVDSVEAELGQISLLVNNAGVAAQGLFQDTSEEAWRRLFAVNVDGAFHAIRAVLPGMLAEKAGCIINISSVWGLRGASCEVAYSATKAALIGLTRSLAAELGPSHIRVNCVAPGVIDTDMLGNLTPEAKVDLAEQTPMGRLGTGTDIAGVVSFLASPAAAFVTGQVLTADGGFSL